MDLHCSPPSNVLERDIGVTGYGALPLLAFFDAAMKLSADLVVVEATLRKEAEDARCPESCKHKTISKTFVILHHRSKGGFDPVKNEWHLTVGITVQLDVLCREPGIWEDEVEIVTA